MKKEAYAYKPVRFFLAANLIMWLVLLVAAYISYHQGSGSGRVISLLLLVGLFSPMGTALWMVFTSRSPELKEDFLDRLLNLKLIRLWTIPAIFFIVPAIIVVSVVLSHVFFNESLSQLAIVKTSPFSAGLIPAQLLLFLAPVIEEIGWKGYGVESLRGRRSFLKVTLIFAALWAFWHGGTFFINGYYQNMLIRTDPLFALNFIASFFPATVIFNWLWYKNRGSILTAILLHGAIDFQGVLQMGQIAKCIETVVMFIIAIAIVMLNKKMFFGEFPAQIGHYDQ